MLIDIHDTIIFGWTAFAYFRLSDVDLLFCYLFLFLICLDRFLGFSLLNDDKKIYISYFASFWFYVLVWNVIYNKIYFNMML